MHALAALAAIMGSAPAGTAYGDALLARELRETKELAYAAIDLAPPTGAHFQAGARPPGASQATVPLADALGNRIGTLTIAFRSSPKKADAAALAVDISRHVYSSASLGEPDPFVAGTSRSARGERLVERELGREPGLVTIAFHVALPGRDNRIIASNFGRIGKAGDADDQRVIASSSILQEVTNGGERLAVELPLLDRKGRTIGALSTSFKISPSGQADAYRSALRVQRDLSKRIPSLESLSE